MRISMLANAGRFAAGQSYDAPGDMPLYHGLALIKMGKAKEILEAETFHVRLGPVIEDKPKKKGRRG